MKRYRSHQHLILWNKSCKFRNFRGAIRVSDLDAGSAFIVLESDKEYRRILSGTSEGWVWIPIRELNQWEVQEL